MCSIAGILKAAAGEPTVSPCAWASLDNLTHMLALQKHRAPDGEGVFCDRGHDGGRDGGREGEVYLGQGRLAILDLSPAGRQPMTSQDGRWTIVFNGEIFNYRELKQQLSGHFRGSFRSTTDTEVLLEACANWGVEKTLQRAAGMFAFALWDSQERELILVRDRLGEKPLVYFWDRRRFAFASELKALAGFHDRRLDPLAVDAYLALGYVPAPLAIFQGCRKLAAGHLLRYRMGGEPRIARWWSPENALRNAVGVTPAQRERELRHRIQRAVSERLQADVPVALALSGGVDSAVIAAECVRQDMRPQTFTVKFREGTEDPANADASEVPFARALAVKLGLRHDVLELRGDHMAGVDVDLHDMVQHYDEPLADSSALGSLALAAALQGRYKVILNGDGGDEVFAGYPHYEHIGIKQLVKRAAAAAGVVDGGGSGGVYVESKVLFRASDRAQLMEPADDARGAAASSLTAIANTVCPLLSASLLQKALWTDRSLPLANGLNFKTDIALGAFGIEGRAPFLDHRVVEWAQYLPDQELAEAKEKKILLRRAYERDLPAEVLRRPKRGFGAPISRWLEGPLAAAVKQELPCPLFARKNQQNLNGQKLWALLVFARWARHWKASW